MLHVLLCLLIDEVLLLVRHIVVREQNELSRFKGNEGEGLVFSRIAGVAILPINNNSCVPSFGLSGDVNHWPCLQALKERHINGLYFLSHSAPGHQSLVFVTEIIRTGNGVKRQSAPMRPAFKEHVAGKHLILPAIHPVPYALRNALRHIGAKESVIDVHVEMKGKGGVFGHYFLPVSFFITASEGRFTGETMAAGFISFLEERGLMERPYLS